MKQKWRNRLLERGVVLDKRRGYVYVRYAAAGRVRKELIGKTSDPDVVDRANWRAQYIRNCRRSSSEDFQPSRRHMLVQDAADVFLKLHGQKRASIEGARQFSRYLERIKQVWAGRYVDTITGDDVRDYRASRRLQGRADSTINREHTVITTLFNRLAEWRRTGQIPTNTALPESNPGRAVRKASEERFVRNRLLSDLEYKRLWECADEGLRRIILAEMNLPLRLADLKQLSKRRVDLSQNRVRGIQVKTNRAYDLPINSVLRDLIRSASEDRILDFTNFRKRWNQAIRSAGLDRTGSSPLQFRDLRRTAATVLHESGVPLRTVSAMLGHATVTTTIRYLGLRDENFRMAGDTLAAKYQVPSEALAARPIAFVETVPETVPTLSQKEALQTSKSLLQIN